MTSSSKNSGNSRKLPRKFYRRKTDVVARELLGKRLVRIFKGRRLSGLIVETEAYMGVDDAACHSRGGIRSSRTETLYLDGGHAYVYLIYGMHWCLNVVTQRTDDPQAVLIRALQPEEGLEVMQELRPVRKPFDLTNGPGKLCRAMKIEKDLDREDLQGDELFIEDSRIQVSPAQIVAGLRIGVDYAGPAAQWPLRFYLKNNPWVSGIKLKS